MSRIRTGAWLATALFALAPAPAWGVDADSDLVPDDQDNCLGLLNPSQIDGDRDGFGNACDADVTGDGAVGGPDFTLLRARLGQGGVDIDLTGDGITGGPDFVAFDGALGTRVGPSGLACAGAVPCACDAPVLDLTEEVLANAVALRWRADSGFGFAVERRPAAGGSWTQVGAAPPGATEFVDATAEPGAHEYRVRSVCSSLGAPVSLSEPSNPDAIDLPEECAGQPAVSAALPVVPIGDLDADAKYTGNDVALALADCAERGGCVLEALPVTYEDVSISISNGDPTPCTTGAAHCLGAEVSFPNGLVIQGHGSRSVFRSPLWPAGYSRPSPLFQLWKRPDIELRIRNLVLDGRKAEQREASEVPNSWQHFGFSTWNEWGDHTQRNTGGCLHGLAIRNFFNRAVSLGDTAGWIVEDGAFEDVGCYEGVTACPLIPETDPPSQVAGFGVLAISFNDDLVIRRNELHRIGKYSIGLNSFGTIPPGPLLRPRVLDNVITEAGGIGMLVAGIIDGVIRGNRIESTQRPGLHPAYFNSFGIEVLDRVENSQFVGNQILGSAGIGLNWQAAGPGNLVADNLIDGSCREKNPDTCAPCDGGPGLCCYNYPDINVGPGAAGDLRFSSNEVTNSLCSMPIGVHWGAASDVVVHGGVYQSGPKAQAPPEFEGVTVTIQGSAIFEGDQKGACVAFRTLEDKPTEAVVSRLVHLVGCDPSHEVETGSSALVCAEEPAACAQRCVGPNPPEWCWY